MSFMLLPEPRTRPPGVGCRDWPVMARSRLGAPGAPGGAGVTASGDRRRSWYDPRRWADSQRYELTPDLCRRGADERSTRQ